MSPTEKNQNIPQETRDKLNAELMDPRTSYERVEEIGRYAEAVNGVANPEGGVVEERPYWESLSDGQLAELLADESTEPDVKAAITNYVHTRSHPSKDG